MTPEQKIEEAVRAHLDAVIASYDSKEPIFAMAIVEYAFTKLGVERLFASMAAENASSVKAAEKLGMTLEGLAEN